MSNLSTTYLGLPLKSPIIVGACPLTADSGTLSRLELAGAGAVVLPSLFEEQLEANSPEQSGEPGKLGEKIVGPSSNEFEGYNLGPDLYLDKIRLAKSTIEIPVIASLNGRSLGGWIKFAELMTQAGADALEINWFDIPIDPELTSHELEVQAIGVIQAIRKCTNAPISVKIGPYISALPNFAKRLFEAGADGLVLFNRYLNPHFNLETFEVTPHLGLSGPQELGLVLRWIAILRSQTESSLAATSGIHDYQGVIRAIMSGADVAMVASVLLKHGPDHIVVMLSELRRWMNEHDFDSLESLRGLMSRKNVMHPQVFERANYTKTLTTYVKQRAQ